MTDFIPTEKGVPIRFPSEANLLVDSGDRGTPLNPQGNPGNFTIARPNNLMNGFFTRITPTEVALDWRIPNISPFGSTSDSSNNNVRVNVSTSTYTSSINVVLPTGLYTCADAIDTWVANFNSLTGFKFQTSNLGNMNTQIQGFDSTGSNAVAFCFTPVNSNNLMGNLNFDITSAVLANSQTNNYSGLTNQSAQYALAKYKYLDFVSPQLTNQQDVKDGTTNLYFNQNSLYRWYLGTTNDSPPNVDKYGFPIYPTYKQFYVRRDLNNPKFIKWEANVPIGNLQFQVLATRWFPADIVVPSTYQNVLSNQEYSWQMTLQASEV